MTDFTIDTLVIPAAIDAPDAADFIAMTHVRNEVEAEVVGSRALAYEPAELLPNWQDPYEPQVCLVARVASRIVARGLYMPTAEEGAEDAWLSVEVLPEFRERERVLAAAGDDYRAISWSGRTPEQWVSGLAVLHQRMSTDAPSAELSNTEQAWDDVRVRSLDDRRAKSPRVMLTTVVEHVPTGALVGFTELSVPPEIERPVEQRDTLVLKEHRGHRLGMLLKLENLRYLAQCHPGHPSVNTFNAEENRPMLDVNEALGFIPVGYAGAWKKVV